MSTPAASSGDGAVVLSNIPAAVIITSFSIVGIIGNTLVITAVTMSRRLQTTTNVFVVTLSCVDFLSALILPYQVVALLGGVKPYGPTSVFCQVIGALSYVFIGWSIITLIVIAFNRYFLITQPLQRYRMVFCKRNIAIIIVIVLSYPIVPVITFIVTGWATFGLKNDVCSLVEGLGFNILSGISMITLMAAIIFLYVRIYLHVREHVRKIASNDIKNDVAPSTTSVTMGNGVGQQEGHRQKRDHKASTENKISKNMFFVIICFFICMLPITVTLFDPGVDPTVVVYFFVVLSLNCCINPVIYAWKHPDFRQVFRCLATCHLRKIEEPSRWLRERLTNAM
ncbi:alpha-1A adrenergic receptor-like [Diadema antillarum]|uniref:alpha-1A adrenergic receptor-like n=1 Tax=Diadema antillarum TaxID=105358 RepID=UPI003A893A17